MRVLEEIARERNITLSELFREMWTFTFGKPCRSDRIIILDSARYAAKGIAPGYAGTWLRAHQKLPSLPPQASQAYHRFQITRHFRLIDPEPGPQLMARKGKDGIFRC